MCERERYECKTCCYAISGAIGSITLDKKIDEHYDETGHTMQFVSESNAEEW